MCKLLGGDSAANGRSLVARIRMLPHHPPTSCDGRYVSVQYAHSNGNVTRELRRSRKQKTASTKHMKGDKKCH